MIYEENIPANVRGAFTSKVKEISSKYGFRADWLMIVMRFESTSRFFTGNHGNGATGLIGFRASTAKDLGTTQAALASMTQVQQLAFVDKYLSFWKVGGKVDSLTDLYMFVYSPINAGKPNSYVLSRKGTSAYEGNKGLDIENKGYITVGDVGEMIKKYAGNVPLVSQTSSLLIVFILIAYLIYRR